MQLNERPLNVKTISFEVENAKEYKNLLKNTIGAAPEQGYTIDQVRMGIKVLDKIEASTDEKLALEDAEYAFVRERIESIKWSVATPQVIAFYDAVTGAQ